MSKDTPETNAGKAEPKRVGRPRRLTTPEVVDTAIELADDLGLEGLSMPSLARQLGVGTMTLYGYVENKDDLLDKMAIRLFENLEVPAHAAWKDGLFAFFCEFRGAALAHTTLAGLLAGGRITIPAVFDILEGFFQEMIEDGVPIDDAVRVFYAALTYTIGFVLWEIPRAHLQPETAYADQWTSLISQLDPKDYPVLTSAAIESVTTVASPTQFDWGLNKILNP